MTSCAWKFALFVLLLLMLFVSLLLLMMMVFLRFVMLLLFVLCFFDILQRFRGFGTLSLESQRQRQWSLDENYQNQPNIGLQRLLLSRHLFVYLQSLFSVVVLQPLYYILIDLCNLQQRKQNL